MNIVAPALCLIAQASFHTYFLLLLDVSRFFVHIYISHLDFIVHLSTFVLPPIVHFLILPILHLLLEYRHATLF
jgi:hypothetical protein